MTPEVISLVWQKIDKTNASQYELARKTGLTQATISRLLSGERGALNESWQKLLDALELELTVIPKQSE